MTGPQAALADFCLQRSGKDFKARIVDVPLAAKQMIEGFDLLPHETVDPVELFLEFRFGFKIPHAVILSVKKRVPCGHG